MANYQSSSAAASLPNSYYNDQPRSNYHGSQLPPDSVRRNNKHLDNCIFVAALVVFCLIFYGIPLFLWDRYWGKDPDFRLDSFSVSNFTFTNGSRVFMTSDVQLTARNPNLRYSLGYDRVETCIYYKHQLLFQTFLPPFSQETKNKTSLVAKFEGDGNVVDKWVVDGINADIAREGSVEFNFRLISSIVWRKSFFSGLDYLLKVSCRDLVVEIPSDGSRGRLTGKPKTCEVGEKFDDSFS